MSAPDRHRVAVVFGAVLRAARQGAGLSQEAFAHEAGMDRTYPSLLERGRRQPSLTVLISIATALGIEPALLVSMTIARLRREAG
jgi:transcriptional regulator with XRE-family HTH domain